MWNLLLFLLLALFCSSGCDEEALFGKGGGGDNGGGTPEPPPGGGGPDVALYGVNVFTSSLFTIDPDTGRLELIGPLDENVNVFNAPTAMAVRASDDAIFVWNNTNGPTLTGVLLRVDRCTGQGTPVSPSTAPQGRLDGIAFQGSRLWGVGPAEGSMNYALYEVITSTGIKLLQGGDFPPMAGLDADSTQTLHAIEQVSTGNNPLGLFVIDTVDAAAMRIADLDSRIVSGASLVFDGDTLFGTGQSQNGDSLIFEIDPLTGDIANVLITEQTIQGMGVSTVCDTQGTNAIRNGNGNGRPGN